MSHPNVRHVNDPRGFDVYIGRAMPRFPGGTRWANQFKIPRDGDRAEVIAKYRAFWEPFRDRLNLDELRGKVLGCWCAPEACHGDVLAEWAENELAL